MTEATTSHSRPPVEVDVLIFGGGIAGLAIASSLAASGYRPLVLERHALGAGQTLASQGIIHGGLKYAITESAASASRAISAMPSRWLSAIRHDPSGRPIEPGLTPLLSDSLVSSTTCLWTTQRIGSKLAAMAAARVFRTGVTRLEPASHAAFANARGVDVYRVDEPVLDVRRVVESLSGRLPISPRIWNGDWTEIDHLRPRCLVFAAGSGNESLAGQAPRLLGIDALTTSAPRQQLRPLHMVYLRAHASLIPEIHGHCVGLSDKPRLTITSLLDSQGRRVWTIGGQIAESGLDRTRDAQIEAARSELSQALPWIPLDHAEMTTIRWDRAEGLTPEGRRPDEPVVAAIDGGGRALAVWPTKLAFAPLVADLVLDRLRELPITPGATPSDALDHLPIARVAQHPFEQERLVWSSVASATRA